MKYGRFPIKLNVAEYAKPRGLAIQMITKADDYDCDEPFEIMTVNLYRLCNSNYAFVDTNNLPEIEKFIEKYKLGKPTGKLKISGFCCYPLYEFDLDEIAKYKEYTEE